MRYLFFILVILITGFISAQTIIVELEEQAVLAQKQKMEVSGISIELQPLLENHRGERQNWFLATPTEKTELSDWDLAHLLKKTQPEIRYAEPDQVRVVVPEAAEDTPYTEGERYDNYWGHPKSPMIAWHLGSKFSQLQQAREEVARIGGKVRIAHLDTGYDPNHITTPANLQTHLQKNFVKGENPDSAVDTGSEGFLKQPGHGTATLAILAGNKVKHDTSKFDSFLGGAPQAEIVPIRLSKSVILFQTSAFVKALYYISDPAVKCDVLSMSMGGVASKYWADAVNDAYERGVTLVTAAGNNFAGLPTRYVVYPARFHRVIAVCGVTFAHKPYYRKDGSITKMQGNWGPKNVMKTAIAAYTPNMPWAKMGSKDKVGLSGGGTSSATPQVAAAAALWLQKYRNHSFAHPWQRVNAVRHALFSSADKSLDNSQKYYGNGVLKAWQALQVAPQGNSQPLPKDEVRFPYLTIILGWDIKTASEKDLQMYEVELLQLEHNHPKLQQFFHELRETEELSLETREEIIQTILEIPEASNALKDLLRS